MASQQDLTLGAEFPRPTLEQWRALVDKVLNGGSFERKLVSHTYDGRTIQPLYTAADRPAADGAGLPGLAPFTRGRTAGQRVVDGWDVRQRHAGPDPAAVNEAILEDLEGGVTSIVLGPVGDGSAAAVARALTGVHLDLAPICLDWGAVGPTGLRHLEACWQAAGIPPSAVLGEGGLDPLGVAARSGAAAETGPAVEAAARLSAGHGQFRTLRVDASLYALAGASEAQELAFALATGVAYLRALVDAGLGVDDALGQLSFTLVATPDQFATLTKLRAARRCWDRVAQACGVGATSGPRPSAPARGMYVTAVTSLAHYSQRAPWVNPLRATLACFAAATGGADAITVLPMGAASGHVDTDGRRLARNTQIVLAEESGLGRIVDPGGGAFAIERLTDDVATEGWRRFQEIERQGGMAAVLASGWAAAQVAETWSARLRDLATRREPLIGVSEYAIVAEPAPVRGDTPPIGGAAAPSSSSPFPLRRLAAPFEALRDAADTAPQRPRCFLANLGPLAVHAARAGFARNLFEVAGFDVIAGTGTDSDPGSDTAEALAAELAASGAPVAVICSSDAVYAERAAPAAAALRNAGARRIYLAGSPGEQRHAYEAAGIDEFVFVGCDALDVLRRALSAASVAMGDEAASGVRTSDVGS